MTSHYSPKGKQMKLTHIPVVVITLSLLFSNIVSANGDKQTIKQWNVGFGSYAITVDHEEKGDDDFSGLTTSTTFAFSDNMSIRGQYYALELDNSSDVDVSGFDVSIFYGSGLVSEGFKAYIGIGLYSETHDSKNIDDDFGGVSLNGGIGYNWKSVYLDLSLGIRSTGDYEDLYDDGTGITAVSCSLVFGFRY